jgi:hypothetical protein
MNGRDSRGFWMETLEIDQEIILLEYPARDLREWMMVGTRQTMGFIHQYGPGRFQVMFPSTRLLDEPAFAFTRLDQAMRAVEFARVVQAASGICSGVQQ